ncbi:MAG: SLBB domain-containing protein, partial [Woeseiaceae bacterium]
IKKVPLWRDYETVNIEGEVRFPGSYPIKRGERLSAVVARAGGLTDLAFAKGAVFLREDLRIREEQQLKSLAERLEGDIAASVANEQISRSESSQQELLRQLRSTEATGRLVISLETALAGDADNPADILLRNGDELLIPRISQTVTVIGEVQHPTSHVLQEDVTHKEYLRMSGGMTSQADERRVYVVRANGSVVSGANGRLRNRRGEIVYPGDTIVVPVEADPVSKMALWTSVSTIVYNIGVAAAAVASF